MIIFRSVRFLDGSTGDLEIPSEDCVDLNGMGLTAFPALVDTHVHFRVPGQDYKEDWGSGARAALSGGVTTVIDMPNNSPPVVTMEGLLSKREVVESQLEEAGLRLNGYFYLGAHKEHLDELPRCGDQAIGLKIFMGSSTGGLLIDNDEVLDELFRIASKENILVGVHAECEHMLRQQAKLFEGQKDPAVHSKIRCREAAVTAAEKAIGLVRKYGTRLMILHMSTADEVDRVRQAKAEGLPVFAEATPHHLFLTTEAYKRWGTWVQMNPPLREERDIEGLWEGLRDGTIDVVGTDHAPHSKDEKGQEYGCAPSGVPSVELMFPLLLNACHEGKISMGRLVELCRTNAQKIFGLPDNEDYVLVDLEKVKAVNDEDLQTKSGWSPYRGWDLKGWPVYTVCQGRVFRVDQGKVGPQPIKERHQLYSPDRSYEENFRDGPFFQGPYPQPELDERPKFELCGLPLNSPLGVPAGPLLNGKWTSCAAKLGFDVVTYKTVRSIETPCHPRPNVVFVDTAGDLQEGDFQKVLESSFRDPVDLGRLSITNSFGIPSQSWDYLKKDIPKAKADLNPGQVLIVSVVGSAHAEGGIVEDFVRIAAMVKDLGVDIVEADLSCPNVCTGEGNLDQDPQVLREICQRMLAVLGDTPLTIKVGLPPSEEALHKQVLTAARCGVAGICGVNTIPMKVQRPDGRLGLDDKRQIAGVCGAGIRLQALNWVKSVRNILDKEKIEIALLATGGVLLPEHFDDFLEAGADIAMSATGMMWNPYLARDWKKERSRHGQKRACLSTA